MNVCVLTHTFPRNEKDFSGAFMKEFSDGLSEAGAKVTVVTPFSPRFKRSGDSFDIVTYKYVWPDSLHILGYSKSMQKDTNLRLWNFVLLPFMILFGTICLFKTVKKKKINVINAHWILPNGIMAMIVSRLTSVPYVVTLPGTDVYLATRYKIFGWVARVIAGRSSGLVSNSSFLLSKILKLGVFGKKTAVINYPVDVSFFKPVDKGLEQYRNRYGIAQYDLVLLAVGRFVYKKGFDYLIKAMPEIIREFPRTKLLLGGNGEIRDDLESLAVKLGVKDDILFVGNINRNEILYYYNMADVMVAPSIVDKQGNVDGGPVTAFESMACGKPQVVTDILGAADVIRNGINGFKVPQKNVGKLSGAIIRVLESKEARIRMGKENRKLIVQRVSTKKVGQNYLDFFKNV